jgi:hypothetical protein
MTAKRKPKKAPPNVRTKATTKTSSGPIVVQAAVPAPPDPLAMLVQRMVADPKTEAAQVERILAMHERTEQRASQMAYDAAMARMQPLLPIIAKDGTLILRDRDDQGEPLVRKISYPRWEDIAIPIVKLISQHGYSLTHRVKTSEANDRVEVTAVLAHIGGHREQTTMGLPADFGGGKNGPQALASSTSQAKRYTSCLLIGVITKGEDDDGASASKKAGAATISDQQLSEIERLILDSGSNTRSFCTTYGIEAVKDLPAAQFQDAAMTLDSRLRRKK